MLEKNQIYFLVACLVILFANCRPKDCFQSAGEPTMIQRELKPFHQIEIYNYFNVFLKSDTANKVEIKAGAKIVQNIETLVTDSVLVIKDLNRCNFIKGYAEKELYISVDSLTKVVVHDGLNLYSTDTLKEANLEILYLSDIGHCNITIDCSFFSFSNWYASGNFIFKGKTNYLYLSTEVTSHVFADSLQAGSCYVSNNSMGDCHVSTNGALQALIKNSGNIFYFGSPSPLILEEKTGSGKLIKK
jgi:hypothetical protein